MSESYASPRCGIEIYPFEGGKYAIDGDGILECTVEKSLRSPIGTANIVLPAGGPNGQTSPSWGEIITLQSLVIIAMERAGRSNVIFVGVVLEVQEEQKWEFGRRVVRECRIVAGDWGIWFADFNWSSLSYLAVDGALAASSLGLPAQDGLPSILTGGLEALNPAQVAQQWFTNIMGGSQGVLAKTYLNWKGDSIDWSSATFGHFEKYPYNATFPGSVLYVSNAGSWYSKFSEICDWPFYEIIIGTTPKNIWYGSGSPSAYDTAVQYFGSSVLTEAVPATPGIVCRLNRMPDLITQQSGKNITYAASANLDLWNALPSFEMAPGTNFIESVATLNLENYFNFFVLNPTNLKSLTFGAESTNTPGILFFAYGGAVNPSGIHRFGMRSMVKDTPWLADPTLIARQAPNQDFGGLIAAMTTRMASYYSPIPVMESASVSMPLRPDIFVGCKFAYQPFRYAEDWQFYIHTVTHRFVFGGPSVTELGLERGLPASIYSDATLMKDILIGNAKRYNGAIVSGLPAGQQNPLQPFGIQDFQSIQKVLGEIASIYVTPGSR